MKILFKTFDLFEIEIELVAIISLQAHFIQLNLKINKF